MTRPAKRSPGRARLVAVLGAVVALTLLVGACSGSDGSSSSTTTSTPDEVGPTGTAPPVRVFSDPAQPISVAIGEQFAIVLPAQPSAGLSWQPSARPDPAILLSIGTEFRDAADAVSGQTLPPDTVSQVLRYGARALGTAQIILHYGPPGAAQPDAQTMTFSVTVIDPSVPTTLPPPPPETTTTTAAPPSTTRTTIRPRTTTTTTRAGRTTTTT